MHRWKSVATVAIVFASLLAPVASAGSPPSGPRAGATLQTSVGQRLAGPLSPVKSPGASGLTLSEGHSWLPIDAAILARAKAAAGRGNDFSITATPASRTITQGSSTTYTVAIARTSGKAQKVGLSVTGLPADTTAAFNPTSVTGNACGGNRHRCPHSSAHVAVTAAVSAARNAKIGTRKCRFRF